MDNFRGSKLIFLFAYSLFFSTIIHAADEKGEEVPAILWHVHPECGSESDIIDGTEAILNRRATTPFDSTTKTLSGEISQSGQKWRVRLVIRDGDREYDRSLRVNTCQGAMEVAILLSALAVDSQRVLQSEDPKLHARIDQLSQLPSETETEQEPLSAVASTDETEEPQRVTADNAAAVPATDASATNHGEPRDDEPQRESKPVMAPSAAQTDARKSTLRKPPSHRLGMLGLGATMNMGLLSAFRPGVALRGAWYRSFWMLAASVHYLPPVSSVVARGVLEARWTSQAVLSTLMAGHQYAFRRMGLGWSLGARLIGIRAGTQDIATTRASGVWVGAGVLGAQLTWQVSNRFGLWLTPSAVLLLARPKFLVTGIGMIHQPERVIAEVTIGLFYVFGNGKAPLRPFIR